MVMKEVYPGIFLLKEVGRFKSIKPPENVYIIPGSDGIIYDAGYGDKKTIKRLVRNIEQIKSSNKGKDHPLKISRIYLSHSHPDHFSGLFKLRKYLEVKIILTKKQAQLIRNKTDYHKAFDGDSYDDYLIVKKGIRGKFRSFFERLFSYFIYNRIYHMTFIQDVDEIIEEETEITINREKWKIFPSPGHSSDHISLYNEENGILFAGDNILESITTWLGPPNSDIEAYINSIKYIQNLPHLTLILPAHGNVISNPQERISEILDHRKERTAQTLQIIKENKHFGISPGEIIKALYPKSNKVIREFARGWVCLTLKSLEKQNKIIRKEEKNHIYFYPVLV